MKRRSPLLLVLASTALSTPALLAQATPVLPTGGKVVAGQATIGAPSNGALTVTQSSGKAIINWNGFSIGSGGKVSFQNGSGATLNRVTGAQVSSLDGLLTGTGSVYLINPNGVIIGRGGVVNVGGTFVASTLDTSNASFLSGGALSFAGSSGAAVVNYGRIGSLGGDVALIATNVSNAGGITAAKGDVGLLAGSSVVLKDASLNDGRFAVLLGGPQTRATNSGLIAAADAELRAEGGNVYALAGDTAGVIRATGVKSGGGKVWLVANQGTLDLAGSIEAQGQGGTAGGIETSGATVKVGAASIDAHGGTWLVDPYDLTIDATAATTIDNALNAGTSVTEQTTATGSSGAGTANANGSGDIIVSAPLSWNTTAGLTLSAYRNVDVNAPITLTGGGALTLYADNAATGLGQASGTVTFGLAGLVAADSASTINVYYNPVSYTDTATDSTLTLRPGFSGPTTYTNPYTANITGGTLSAYMLVDTLAQLGGGLTGVGSQLNGLYALNADIDASSTATANPVTSNSGSAFYGFLPIGFTGANNGGSDSGTDYFSGQFDGQGHTISNLYINHFVVDSNNNAQGANYAGLFGYVNAGPGGAGSGGGLVHDLNLVNATVLASAGSNGVVIGMIDGGGSAYDLTASGAISGGYFTGGLIGTVYGTGAPYTVYDSHASTTVTGGQYLGGLFGQGYNGSTANNVYATGTVGVGQANPASYVGGLVGSGADLSLSNSYATGAVVGTDHVGGLAGYLSSRAGSSNLYATGSVTSTGTGDQRVGGLVGDLGGPLSNAYDAQAVNAQGDNVGGLVGLLEGGATLTNSYATGAVTSTGNDVGGLVGNAQPAFTISDSFATGAVTSTAGGADGGLIGVSFAGTVSQSYASGAVRGLSAVGGLIGAANDYGNYAQGLTVSDTYATGSATGTDTNPANAATDALGGLIGSESHGEGTAGATITVARSYATGLVSGQGVQGGLIGANIGVVTNDIWDRTSTGQANGIGGTGGTTTSNPPVTSVTNLTSVQDTDPTATDYAFSQTPYANAGFSFGNLPGGGGGEVWVQVDVDGTFNGAGAATATRPFLLMEATPNVSNAHQLQLLDLFQFEQNPAPYTLIADVDASGTARLSDMWGPQGFVPLTRVEANFDGQGHTISDLTVTTAVLDAGLFDTILDDLTVQNLTLAGGSFTATGNDELSAGTLAGVNDGFIVNVTSSATVKGVQDVGGLVGSSSGTITEASASGAVSVQSTFTPSIGGLVGANSGSVTASSASGSVSDFNTTASGGESGIGGLFGTNSTDIEGLSASGAVTSLADPDTGGLVGLQVGAVDGASASGVVKGAAFTGGLIGVAVGASDATGLISNSFATGPVNGTTSVGGLVGASSQSFSNSSATGKVSGTDAYVGGLVGQQGVQLGFFGGLTAVATSIQNSHALGDVSGVGFVGGLIGGTSAAGTTVGASYATGAVMGLGGDFPVFTGGLIGYAPGVTVTGSYATGAVSGAGDVGGLVGDLTAGRDNNFNPIYASVSGSYATGAVTSSDLGTGGLIGVNESGSVTDSFATGAVSGTGQVGGLVGQNLELNASNTGNSSASNPLPTVQGSVAGLTYASGQVMGSGSAVGGLVGDNQGVVSNASYTGAQVSGVSQVGGLVGLLEVATQVDSNGNNFYTPASVAGSQASGMTLGMGSGVGGLVGVSTGGSVTDSFATGAVAGVNQVGGLVGENGVDTTSNPGTTYHGSIAGSVAGATYATGLVVGTGASAGGLVGENQGSVTDVAYQVAGGVQVLGVSGAADVGGLIGLNDSSGTVSTASVQSGVRGTSYTGGVAGDNFGALSTTTYDGAVSGGGGVGGIAGVNEASGVIATASVGSKAATTVTGTADDVGGIAGASFAAITDANVGLGAAFHATGVDRVGGLVGYNFADVAGSASGSVAGQDYVGGVVGDNASGTVTGVIPGALESASVQGEDYVGGLVGWNEAPGIVQGLTASGQVTASGDYVGGAVGVNRGQLTSLTYGVVATGVGGATSVVGAVTGADQVGGLVGLNQGNLGSSSAFAPVTGNLYVGGLVGWNDTGAAVRTSYATGTVTGLPGGQDAAGNDYVGGLVGVNFGSLADTYATGSVSGVQVVGGLVGTNMPGGASVATSYATGKVSASAGAVGSTFGVQAGEVTDVYGFPALSGQPVESGYYNTGATGDGTDLTPAQEDGSAAYAGFDFTDTWQSNPDGPPTLKPSTN